MPGRIPNSRSAYRFFLPLTTRWMDNDVYGHVNNVVYLRYTQDAAVAHWHAAAGSEYVESMSWVVRRHEIDYLQPAFDGDDLLTRTWVGASSGAPTTPDFRPKESTKR